MTWIVLVVFLSLYVMVLIVLTQSMMMMNNDEQSFTDGCLDILKTDPKDYPFKFDYEYDQPFLLPAPVAVVCLIVMCMKMIVQKL
ncbi:hypothetical protein HanRHA438_Chr01g0003951 [Helianthus annuus]|nr:hypothetical protein HanRHA438_Chr01g0003951 [Helianthus annuus]KAJ0955496.1 hypothetical protein HanPSC8_Chr01g0003531 [Helianthus annuus]